MKKKDEIKVCLVGSSGGHLTHLYMLKPFWKDKNRFWVTFDKEDARSLLEGEKVYPCYFPTNRSIKALIKNTKIAWDVLHKEKPDLIISCGAAVAVPFFYIGKTMGAKLIYIEVFDRIDKPTMTGKMVYLHLKTPNDIHKTDPPAGSCCHGADRHRDDSHPLLHESHRCCRRRRGHGFGCLHCWGAEFCKPIRMQ